MSTATQKHLSQVPNVQGLIRKAPSIRHQPRTRRYYFDVGLGSVCLSGRDTGGAYCLLDVGLAPGMAVRRHTHTREDEVYLCLRENFRLPSETRLLFFSPAILCWPRATSLTSYIIRQHHELLSPRIFTFWVRRIHHGNGRSRA